MTDPAPSSPGKRDSWTLVAASAVAALALGRAIQVRDGRFSYEAIAWVTIALLALLLGVLGPRIGRLERKGEGFILGLLGIGLVAQFAQLVGRQPASYMTESSPDEIIAFRIGMGAVGLVALWAVFGSKLLRRLATPLLLAGYLVAGAWVIQSAPEPRIDVVQYHRQSIDALVSGENPYAIQLTNPYDPAPVDFGFPYPPLSLLMSAPGQILLGDYRYAHLLAVAITGALIAYSRPSPVATGAAALFLFTPRAFYVIEEGWTEPLMVLLVAAVGTAALRWPREMPYLAGALLVSKQYAVLLLPALAAVADLSSWRSFLRQAVKAAAVALVLTAPFFLWNPERFVYDLVILQTKFVFNPDGLSFLSLWSHWGDAMPPLWLGIALVPLAGLAVILRAPKTASGFAAGAALITFALFAFSRYAYANYYFFILGALWVAVGLSRAGPEPVVAAEAARDARDSA